MPSPDDSACHAAESERNDCYVAPIEKTTDPSRIGGRALAHLALSGLGCANCVTRVRNALLAVEGVLDADVALEPQRAQVGYDPTRTYPEHLAEAVFWAGAASTHPYRAEITLVRTLEGGSVAATEHT